MPKVHAPLFLLLLVPAASVRAQVRAYISESRVITEKPGEAKARMAKIGDVVRTVVQSSADAENLFHFRSTVTTDRISDTIAMVPDSLFVVPAGYTKTMPIPTGGLRSLPAVP